MENNNKLTVVPQSSLLNKVNSSIGITNKLITENNKKLVAEIFESNPKFCIDLISAFYPLTSKMLVYDKILNWNLISQHNDLSTILDKLSPIEFIKIESLSWGNISGNKNIIWSLELINSFSTKWNWSVLSENTSIPWSEQIIDAHLDKWNWYSLSKNKTLPLNRYLLDKYSKKWDFKSLSWNIGMIWSEEILEKYSERWNWRIFTIQLKSNLTEDLLLRFQDKWDWSYLSFNFPYWNYLLIEKFKKHIIWEDYFSISNNNIPWSMKIIAEYQEKWDWHYLSCNKNVYWNEQSLNHYSDRINYAGLSLNESIVWTFELLEKHEKQWNWERLSRNKTLPWNEKLISKYESQWKWFDNGSQKGLSSNENLPWSDNFIEKYSHKWNWGSLINNKGINWTVKLLHRYAGKLVYPNYNSSIIWDTLSPYIDDELVFKLLEKIKNGKIDLNNCNE